MTNNIREVGGWEKEFDAQFAKGFYNGDWVLFYCPTSDKRDEHPATEQDIKSFIHHQLQKAQQAGRDEAVEVVKGMIDHQAEYGGQPFGDVYNSAYNKVIKALQDKK